MDASKFYTLFMKNQTTRTLIEGLRKKYASGEPVKILFVCLGNICRSPAAEGVMLNEIAQHGDEALWELDSAGTGGYHIGELPDRRMRVHAAQRGLDLVHRTRKIETDDFDRFDMIIGMDASNLSNLRALAPSPEAEAKIVGMSEFFDESTGYDYVPDPYYEGAEGFELVLDLLFEGCSRLYGEIAR